MEIKISTIKNENGTLVTLKGKLNTLTSQELAKEFDEILADAVNLTIEMKDVDYVSSAGLRLLVTAQKKMKAKNGTLTIKNVQEEVYEVFVMTRLSGVFHIVDDK